MISTQPPVPLKIIVVGSGLIGLSAALCLSTKGHDVTVLEKCSTLQTGGADLQCAANAAKILSRIGLLHSLSHVLNPKTHIHWRGWHSMDVFARHPIDISANATN